MSTYDYSVRPPPPATNGLGEGRTNEGAWDNAHANDLRAAVWNSQRDNYRYMSSSRPPLQSTYSMRAATVEPNPNLYIHNVPKDAREEEIKDLFSAFGTVEKIRLKVNQKIGPQAVYAFVTFSTTEQAQLALQKMNGYEMRSRRLRIEFQRFRDDEQRIQTEPVDGHVDALNDLYTQQQRRFTQKNDSMARRKRTIPTTMSNYIPGLDQLVQDSALIGGYKRIRHQIPPSMYYQEHPPQYSSVEQRAKADFHQQSSQTQARSSPVTIYLCDQLHPLFPDLFKDAEAHPSLPKQKIFPQQAVSHMPNSSLSTPKLDDPPLLKPGLLLWTGYIVRNGKKKAVVDLCYLSGKSPASFIPQDLQILNISHRSTWEDLLKKVVWGTCILKVSDQEVNKDGSNGPQTPQQLEMNCKIFNDHMQYLRQKERAGVIALPNNLHLYVIPAETSIFEKYSEGLADFSLQQIPHALGLFITGAAVHPGSNPTGQSTPSNPRLPPHQIAQRPLSAPAQDNSMRDTLAHLPFDHSETNQGSKKRNGLSN